MKHFIITLLSGSALVMSGFAFAGGKVVDAPMVQEAPVIKDSPVQKAPVIEEEMVKTPVCETVQGECDDKTTTDVSEAEKNEDIIQEVSAS